MNAYYQCEEKQKQAMGVLRRENDDERKQGLEMRHGGRAYA